MKILNYGSLNIDYTYEVHDIVKPGETIHAKVLTRHAGGKGLNQSIALARAGACVCHAGKIGTDGLFLKALLTENNIRTDCLLTENRPTGHAVIQVNAHGQNCIIVFGGANTEITTPEIDDFVSALDSGDIALCQNETSNISYFVQKCHEKNIKIAFNPSPMTQALKNDFPFQYVTYLFINEIEGFELTGAANPDDITASLLKKYPQMQIILTLGAQGALYADSRQKIFQPAFPAKAVDTTAAGDTFTGYFLHSILKEKDYAKALRYASMASCIAVSKKGASDAIPYYEEVLTSLKSIISFGATAT